ncbi:MAG: T9SS type A sorting domain-containing protein, partial [Flammeovirgaceae bacterium]|nr:T9SS type A sorting domain-containing protein [Flammeovirgaceae bacterium]
PYYDWALEDFKLIANSQSGFLVPQVTIRNLSNLKVDQTDVIIQLSSESQLKASIFQSIPAGVSLTYTFSFDFDPSLDYVCAEIRMDDDSNPDNDSRCIDLDETVILINPYPNPATDVVNVDWISPEAGNATVVIYESTGQKSFEFTTPMQEGLNQMEVNLEGMGPGLYIVVLYSNQVRLSRSFVIY